jgi:hypothetical protein
VTKQSLYLSIGWLDALRRFSSAEKQSGIG